MRSETHAVRLYSAMHRTMSRTGNVAGDFFDLNNFFNGLMKKYFLLMLMSGFCFSCGISYTPEIERALQQAGRNRRELGKVLKHYRRTPSDSLKYKAAEFLIANMPGKYSEYRDAPWNDVATVYLRWTSAADRQRVLEPIRWATR